MKTITVQSPLLRFASLHRTENDLQKDPGERKCADTIGTVQVPWAGHFQCQNINIFLQLKCTEVILILSDNSRKLLLFEISKSLIAV